MEVPRTFASDNFSSVDPRVMNYLTEINAQGHAKSYEGDTVTQEAEQLFVETFGDGTDVIFVPSGTGANILGISLLLQRPYEAVMTTSVSHVYEEESGALAAFSGTQIFPLPHENGKLSLGVLEQDVKMRKELEFHSALPKVVSIANSTEYGTYYTNDEIRAIADFCHDNNMFLHLDGCRLVNVAAAQGLSLRECSRDLGVDVMSFGGAKNGLMSAEAVVIFNAPDSEFRRAQKQAMQLVSKMRFVAGQFIPYLRDEAWRDNAVNANQLARRLADGTQTALGGLATFRFTQPVDTNQVFCVIPKDVKKKLRAAGHQFYDWNTEDEIRFVTSWDNTEEDVDSFVALMKS